MVFGIDDEVVIGMDSTHSTHISSKMEDGVHALNYFVAEGVITKIADYHLEMRRLRIRNVGGRNDIHDSNVMTVIEQSFGDVRALRIQFSLDAWKRKSRISYNKTISSRDKYEVSKSWDHVDTSCSDKISLAPGDFISATKSRQSFIQSRR